jgi:hypothetical protein
VKVPFTWKVTGWFMVGWSPEFPVGEVCPLHYFGEDLVAVDDECSDLFYSIWWPRSPGDSSDVPQGKLRELFEKQFLSTVFDDLQIWHHQKYVERPPLSKVDAKGYMALRKWATQFYECPP